MTPNSRVRWLTVALLLAEEIVIAEVRVGWVQSAHGRKNRHRGCVSRVYTAESQIGRFVITWSEL